MKLISEIDFTKGLKNIYPLTKDKKIVVSLNMMRVGLPNFDFNKIIQLLLNYLSPKELAIQSYSNFESITNRVFSKYNSNVSKNLSSLSKLAFNKYPHLRLLSSTHSFILFNGKSEIYDHIFKSAFGVDSVFSFFLENDYIWINIGSYLNETCTFMHHVEAVNSQIINYRKNIVFPVKVYKDIDNKASELINYEYFSRIEGINSEYSWLPIQNAEKFKSCIVDRENLISVYNLTEIFSFASDILKKNPKVFLLNKSLK